MLTPESSSSTGEVTYVRIGTTHVMVQFVLGFGFATVMVCSALLQWVNGEADVEVLIFVGVLAAALMTAVIVEGVRESGRYLEIDEHGITYVQRSRRTLLPWHDVLGVGVGLPRPTLAMRLSKTLPTRTFYVDVYVRDPDRPAYEAIGGRWRVDTDVGYRGMRHSRFRFQRFLGATVDEIRDGVRRHHPGLWLDDRLRRSASRLAARDRDR